MKISDILIKMVDYSNGNLHDINHFLKVYAYAKMIGERERLSPFEQESLEIAAIVHDIACPLCREKYGNTDGRLQEAEGAILARVFLKECDLSDALVERVVFLVEHHHTLHDISSLDHQILVEADYLVNADESRHSQEVIKNTMQRVFKTQAGIALLKAIFDVE